MRKHKNTDVQQLTLFGAFEEARDTGAAEDPAKARRKALAKALYERYYGGGK